MRCLASRMIGANRFDGPTKPASRRLPGTTQGVNSPVDFRLVRLIENVVGHGEVLGYSQELPVIALRARGYRYLLNLWRLSWKKRLPSQRLSRGSLGAAAVGQAVVFGVEHGYQGGKKAIEISVIGLLFGILAAWRKNLRVNMLAHTWSDIWGGWLRPGA